MCVSTHHVAYPPFPPLTHTCRHSRVFCRPSPLQQLITMGFQEEHVHRGTACVGFDLNALLSWLVDHPDGGTTPAEQASAAARCGLGFVGRLSFLASLVSLLCCVLSCLVYRVYF